MEWIKELGEFLWAVINNWAGYATGGVIVAILWLWSTYFQKSVSKRWGIALAIFFLTIAVFNAWREQHQGLLVAQKKLDVLTLPMLEGDMMVAYGPIGKDNQDTIVTVAGVIKNKGAPTVLDKWEFGLCSG
jgi:MFS superfamily sulfate permease-like transporter